MGPAAPRHPTIPDLDYSSDTPSPLQLSLVGVLFASPPLKPPPQRANLLLFLLALLHQVYYTTALLHYYTNILL